MTIGAMTLLGLTGSLVLLKLGLMAFALALVAKTLSSSAAIPAPIAAHPTLRRRY